MHAAARLPVALVVLLAASSALAGCIAPADDLVAPPAAAPAVALPWTLLDCRYVVAFVPVPAERVQPHLPEGFTVASFAAMGLPPDPRGSGNIGVELWVCDEGAGLNGTVADLVYGAVFAAVEPPADLARPDDLLHFVKWDTLVPDEDRRALLAQHGLPVHGGGGSFSTFETAGEGIVFRGTLTMNGTFAFDGSALGPADPSLREFTFTEFQPTPTGLAVWNTTAVSEAAVAGSGRVTMSGLMAEVVGATSAQAYFLAGRGSFLDGLVTLPPAAP